MMNQAVTPFFSDVTRRLGSSVGGGGREGDQLVVVISHLGSSARWCHSSMDSSSGCGQFGVIRRLEETSRLIINRREAATWACTL